MTTTPTIVSTPQAPPRIVVEPLGNRDARRYHTTIRLLSPGLSCDGHPVGMVAFPRDIEAYERFYRNKDVPMQKLFDAFSRSCKGAGTGLIKIEISDYKLYVEKGCAFLWSEIEPGILELLDDYLVGRCGSAEIVAMDEFLKRDIPPPVRSIANLSV